MKCVSSSQELNDLIWNGFKGKYVPYNLVMGYLHNSPQNGEIGGTVGKKSLEDRLEQEILWDLWANKSKKSEFPIKFELKWS